MPPFVTHFLECRADVPIIQVLLGHDSLASTARYARVGTKTISNTPGQLDRLGMKVVSPHCAGAAAIRAAFAYEPLAQWRCRSPFQAESEKRSCHKLSEGRRRHGAPHAQHGSEWLLQQRAPRQMGHKVQDALVGGVFVSERTMAMRSTAPPVG
jgi:hypothetical protein